MMNIVALCLVVTSLVTAGVLSPTPNTNQNDKNLLKTSTDNQEEVLVTKEGLNVIVVEYEREGTGKTKVSISPQPEQHDPITTTTKDVEIGEEKENENEKRANARDVICDAFGKCRHRIASAFGGAKEKVVEKAEETKDAIVETISEKGHGIEQCHDQACEMAKKTLKKTFDTGKTVESHIRRNITEDFDIVRKHVTSKAKEGLETVSDAVKEKEEEIRSQITRARDYARVQWTRAMATLYASVGSLLGVIHLMGFAMAYGMCVWITFVSSYVLANVLPRQQFGVVQSKIYPFYFRAMSYSIGVALSGHVLGYVFSRKTHDSSAESFQGCNLAVSLLMVFANLFYLEPRATKVMFEKMKVEKEEGRGGTHTANEQKESSSSVHFATTTTTTDTRTRMSEQGTVRSQIVGLNERLKKLNSLSSTLNVLSLMALTWHLVYLGQRLHMSSCHSSCRMAMPVT